MMLRALAVCLAAAHAVAKKPHIIVVLTDDLGWNAPGYNNPDLITPALDHLAATGVKLTSHYVYRYCSPTRAALLTGRGPVSLVNVRENFNPVTLPQGTDLGFTMLPARLAEAGYVSHQVGKWHQGFHTAAYLPTARGFNTSYGFLAGGEDHFTQQNIACPWGKATDYWANDAPLASCDVPPADRQPCPQWTVEEKKTNASHADSLCKAAVGSSASTVAPSSGYKNCAYDHAKASEGCFQCKPKRYTGYDLPAHAVSLIRDHDVAVPMFMYLALHNTHAPIEAPPEYEGLYHFDQKLRNTFDGMVSVVDKAVADVSAALKAKQGMWEDTLLIWTTDNGSPVSTGGSNYPFKGGKGSIFEGGVRVPMFINGGFLPDAMRGKILDGKAAVWDYYATFLTLAGVANPTGDDNPLSPASPDSYDMWPYWSGAAATSPRTDILLDHLMYNRTTSACYYDGRVQSMPCSGSGALISGNMKLIVGEIGQAEWFGQFSPNASYCPSAMKLTQCSAAHPCLFNVAVDGQESNDISGEHPDTVAALLQKYHAYDTHWHPPSDAPADEVDLYCKVALQNGGFAGPWRHAL
eukprot:TRINITY_DN22557_c0_g1_i1.p1 TRINITY_DN22557_c0_g1~~TRINITY_DN22557_c0_g1_i1.p1  ORF type:complete len:579 (+),score=146.98 TRINITY_DN22557_c0_g1_i1:55-1791(+)